MSQKTISNRNNAKKSTGPKTPSGKKYSSRNSFKHGFFAKKTYIPEEDKTDFDMTIRNLEAELQPTTMLQQEAIRDLAHCLWRRNLASQLETQQTRALLKTDNPLVDNPSDVPELGGYYSLTPQDLRAAINWLRSVRSEFEANCVLRPEWKLRFDSLFGPNFYPSLARWGTVGIDALLLGDHLVKHARNFNRQ